MFLALVPSVFAEDSAIDTNVLTWMQRTLDAWEATCREDLHISPNPLPWVIFYDSTHAWHVKPEEKQLPPHRQTKQVLVFAGHRYPIFELNHTKELWVPDREPLDLKARAVTMPYDRDTKAFFVLAVPGLVAKDAGVARSKDLDDFFAGNAIHELVHTRQMIQLLPAVRQLRAQYKFPESIDDNLIQNIFGANDEFRKMYEEAGRHMTAALLATDNNARIENARKAVQVIRERQRRFFTGEYEGWGAMEEAWLTMEGAAMWAQFQHALRVAPRGEPWLETISKLSQRTDAWSQMEGLGLFLLIDRLDSAWQPRFFSTSAPPSPLAFLEALLTQYIIR